MKCKFVVSWALDRQAKTFLPISNQSHINSSHAYRHIDTNGGFGKSLYRKENKLEISFFSEVRIFFDVEFKKIRIVRKGQKLQLL